MQNRLDVKEKYEILNSTLNMLLLPMKEISIPYSETVKSCLNELEGDYYTFLNEDYVDELHNAGMISEKALKTIKDIRLKIENINQSKWNIKDFVVDKSWNEVRMLVINLYLLDFVSLSRGDG